MLGLDERSNGFTGPDYMHYSCARRERHDGNGRGNSTGTRSSAHGEFSEIFLGPLIGGRGRLILFGCDFRDSSVCWNDTDTRVLTR